MTPVLCWQKKLQCSWDCSLRESICVQIRKVTCRGLEPRLLLVSACLWVSILLLAQVLVGRLKFQIFPFLLSQMLSLVLQESKTEHAESLNLGQGRKGERSKLFRAESRLGQDIANYYTFSFWLCKWQHHTNCYSQPVEKLVHRVLSETLILTAVFAVLCHE